MKLKAMCLPYGKLPYDSLESTNRMIEKLFATIPYIPILPLLSDKDSILSRTLYGFGFKNIEKNRQIIITKGKWLEKLNSMYNSSQLSDLSSFIPNTPFTENYFEMIKNYRPAETIVSLLGPFSLLQMIKSSESECVLLDKDIRKIIIQALVIKAIAYIKKIKELSQHTKIIIMLEEPLLKNFGVLRRNNEDITREIVIAIFSKVVSEIQQAGAFVGVQSFEKCDWSLPIDAGINLLSFDAYNNPNNIGIIADKINEFIAKGGYINWAIVPVINEEQIKNLRIDDLYQRFIRTVDAIAEQGVHSENIYKRATISVQGDMDKLSIFFAEKVLILASQLAKRLVNYERQNPQESH